MTGHPDSGQPAQPESQDSHPASCQETVRVIVDIRMSNGVHILCMVKQVPMEDLERDKILASVYDLRDRELSPITFEDPFSDMNTDEKSKLLVEFMNQNNTLKEFVEMMKAERSSSCPNDPTYVWF